MKKLLTVLLVSAMLLCCAAPALASSEFSFELPEDFDFSSFEMSSTMAPAVQSLDVDALAQTAGISVLNGAVTVDEDAVTGEVDGTTISGVQVAYDGIGDWDGSAQFGHSGIVLTGEGESVSIGGEEDVYTVNGRGYNSVIVLGAEDKDEANALGEGTRDSSDASEGYEGTGIYVDAESVSVDNTYIETTGYGRSALRLTSGVSQSVIKNSTVVANGSCGEDSSAPGFIMMYASSRPALIESSGRTYFYNDDLYSADWGVYSLDGCYAANVYVVGCYSENTVGGYGAYTLGRSAEKANWTYVYGSYMSSAQYGAIVCAAGRLVTGALADADEDALAQLGDTELGETTLPNGWSYIGGVTNAITMMADASGADVVGLLDCTHTILSSDAVSDRNHEPMADTMELYDYIDDGSIGASYFFLNHFYGSAISVRSNNVDIVLDDCEVYASNGVAVQSVLGYDVNASGIKAADGEEYYGITVAVKNMTLTGDILHEDYQRKMVVTLENAELQGAVVSGTWAGYEQAIADEIAADWNDECDELGIDADAVQDLLADDDSYTTTWGVRMTVGSDSVWTVTGDSSLYSLTIEEGGQVVVPEGASIYVDCGTDTTALSYDTSVGTQVTELQPGTYSGVVIVTE